MSIFHFVNASFRSYHHPNRLNRWTPATVRRTILPNWPFSYNHASNDSSKRHKPNKKGENNGTIAEQKRCYARKMKTMIKIRGNFFYMQTGKTVFGRCWVFRSKNTIPNIFSLQQYFRTKIHYLNYLRFGGDAFERVAFLPSSIATGTKLACFCRRSVVSGTSYCRDAANVDIPARIACRASIIFFFISWLTFSFIFSYHFDENQH